jgi:hypothetical protein
MGAGCAFLDYDGDGWQDLFFVQGAPLPGYDQRPTTDDGRLTPRLYRNRGDGTFTDVTAGSGLEVSFYGMGCSAGDYDADGRPDLYVTAALGPGRLFRNLGKGRFQEVTARAGVGNGGEWGTSCAWLDADLDGRLDLFVCNYVKYRSLKDDIPCYYREGARSYCIPAAYEGVSNRLYRNRGDGTFEDATRRMGLFNPSGKSMGVAVCDINSDGRPDLAVANDTVRTFLYRNRGGGRPIGSTPGSAYRHRPDRGFEDIALATGVAYSVTGSARAGMGIDVAELSPGERPSLVLTAFHGEMIGLYQETGPGSFAEVGPARGVGEVSRASLGFGAFFFDADNDGALDLFVANGHVQDDIEQLQSGVTYAQRPFLFRNDGRGSFAEVGRTSGEPFQDRYVGRGAAWGDVDNDGRLDVVMTTNNGPAYLWRNVTQNGGHWLTVRLRGRRTNADGIGARVTVTAGGKTRSARVRTGSSYLSQSDLRPHFGLGEATRVDRVEVHWPGGRVDRRTNVAVDQILTVVEGEG